MSSQRQVSDPHWLVICHGAYYVSYLHDTEAGTCLPKCACPRFVPNIDRPLHTLPEMVEAVSFSFLPESLSTHSLTSFFRSPRR